MILNKSLRVYQTAGLSQNHLQKLQRLDQRGQRAQFHRNVMKTLFKKFSRIANQVILKKT